MAKESKDTYDGSKEVREASGNIESNDALVCFLYLLMRNDLPSGKVESIMVEVEKSITNRPWQFTNGWLANHAKNIAERLKR